MARLSSRPQLSINDIRHSKSQFSSIYIVLNSLESRNRRLASELNRIDMRREILARHLQKVELEIKEKILVLFNSERNDK